MGRLFIRDGAGHQMNQHYLDNMFPIDSDGKVKEDNEFMETDVEFPDPSLSTSTSTPTSTSTGAANGGVGERAESLTHSLLCGVEEVLGDPDDVTRDEDHVVEVVSPTDSL